MSKNLETKFNINDHVNVYSTYYYNFLQITLSNLPVHMCPFLRFSEDDSCYTDGEILNIGKKFVTATEEDEVIMQILYVLGHEAQHVQSSPNKYWRWGLENGLRVLVSNMAPSILGMRCDDAKIFCREANKKGYHFSQNGLMEIVHFIFNSVEDGRIEKIRCKNSKLFRDEMYVYRGSSWGKNPVQKDSNDLLVIMNQILSLATMGVYQKNYQSLYAGTQLDLFIDELLPIIAKCVNARSCYDCAIAATTIYQRIAPYVVSYFRDNEIDKLMKQLKKCNQAGTGKPNSYPGNTNQEVFGEGQNEASDGNQNDENKSSSEKGKEKKASAGKSSSLNGEESKQKEANKDDSGMQISDQLVKNKGINSIDPNAKKPELTDAEIEAFIASVKEQAKNDLKDQIKDIKSYGARKIPRIKEVFDTSAPVEELKNSTCSYKFRFTEKKRQYPLNLAMPQHLEQRAKAFARKLEKVFEQEEIPELDNRTSGSINNRDVYKIAVGELDFWKKEEEAGELDTCCYFLGDNSGSMGYGKRSKRDYLWQTLTVIEEGFKKYMPLKITAFQELGNKVIHDCVKNWEERYNASCSFNYLMQGGGGASNADGYSIRIATKELLNRPESNKILFILSDGLPAYQNGNEDTALAAKEARNAGIIVVPIYFSKDTCKDGSVDLDTEEAKEFARMYQKNYIITIPERIEDQVIRVLTKLVLSNI